MAFSNVTTASRATTVFEYTEGINPSDVVGGRFDDIAAYLGNVQQAKASAIITIPLAQGTTNNEIANFIPSGALVTSVGIFFTENANVDTSGLLAIGFGNASADVSIVASTQLNAASTDIVINSFTSTSSKHALTASGNAIAFAADSALYFGNTSSLWFQTIVSGADLTATCDVKIVMEYLEVSNS